MEYFRAVVFVLGPSTGSVVWYWCNIRNVAINDCYVFVDILKICLCIYLNSVGQEKLMTMLTMLYCNCDYQTVKLHLHQSVISSNNA